MDELMEQILKQVKERPNRRSGVSLASDQLQMIRGADCGLWSQKLSGKNWDSILDEASHKLVFTNGIVQKRQSNAGLPEERTPDAIADLAVIVTTNSEDRDGDVLEPKGAELDPAAPLLWQHFWAEPIGKVVGILEQNKRRLRAHVAIANTMLGKDAATLAKFGALRISHGFYPTEYEERTTSDERRAFHIKKFKIIEVSLVSIPSNTEAAIQAFVGEKLFHPAVRTWAKSLHDNRTKILTTGMSGPSIFKQVETGSFSNCWMKQLFSNKELVSKVLTKDQEEKEVAVVPPVVETPVKEANKSGAELAVNLLVENKCGEIPLYLAKSLMDALSQSIQEKEDQQLTAALAE